MVVFQGCFGGCFDGCFDDCFNSCSQGCFGGCFEGCSDGCFKSCLRFVSDLFQICLIVGFEKTREVAVGLECRKIRRKKLV